MTLNPRLLAATAAAKAAREASRRLNRGGGTALPGLIAERIDPDILEHFVAQLSDGSVVVTGTNGKTTTCRIITRILRESGVTPVNNREGSNMIRGLISTFVSESSLDGRLKPGRRAGLFEVDEGWIPEAFPILHPRVALFTNLFRDQLDRYFEIDYLAYLWRTALEKAPPDVHLVLNADDPQVSHLAENLPNPVTYFGIEGPGIGGTELEHIADSSRCPTCNTEYEYTRAFYAHLGHHACATCGRKRPMPSVTLDAFEPHDGASRLRIGTPRGPLEMTMPLPGLFNAYNALAAAAVGEALGAPHPAVKAAIEGLTAGFGRLEKVSDRGRNVVIGLVKNPSGFNEMLRTLLMTAPPGAQALFALNDNRMDGRDVSWTWDVDFEMLRGRLSHVTAAGLRARDLALRLKYAELFIPREGGELPPPSLRVREDIVQAYEAALADVPQGGTLFVLPTYTVMLELRETMAERGLLPRFWGV